MSDLQISTDGTELLKHKVRGEAGDRAILYVSGEFNGATAKLQYINGLGEYVDLEDGNLEPGKQYFIEPGQNMKIYVTVEGAVFGTLIDLMLRGLS